MCSKEPVTLRVGDRISPERGEESVRWEKFAKKTGFKPGERVSGRSLIYRVGQKSKLLILSEYLNKTEKIGGM